MVEFTIDEKTRKAHIRVTEEEARELEQDAAKLGISAQELLQQRFDEHIAKMKAEGRL